MGWRFLLEKRISGLEYEEGKFLCQNRKKT